MLLSGCWFMPHSGGQQLPHAWVCAMQNCILNVCQPGSSLLASGYCLYSSSTVFVITVGDGVYGFTYDSIVGEFIMSHPDMKVDTLLSCATPRPWV